MDLNLQGKIAVVTGGSKGIGLACARELAREGARVTIISRDAANIETARKQLAAEGFEVSGLAANLSDYASAVDAVSKIESDVGPIDVLVNSAGAAKRYDPDTLDGEALRAGMEAKYFPIVNMQEAVLQRMRTRKRGAIVNIIGNGGKVGTAMHISGGAANAAAMLSTVGLASYYASQGIRINGINPGGTLTDRVNEGLAVESKRSGISIDDALARAQSAVPMGRFAKPEEVAEVAVFLASDRASYVTGAIVPMDGGKNPIV
ncbi:MAG: SDR family NAD(P)-dependent oxidoreductase [Janthinobacterium lividum]